MELVDIITAFKEHGPEFLGWGFAAYFFHKAGNINDQRIVDFQRFTTEAHRVHEDMVRATEGTNRALDRLYDLFKGVLSESSRSDP